MDIHDYIASGVLEAYCLGSLSDEESKDVYRLSLLHREIASELQIIEETLKKYAALHAVEPDKRLKLKIMAALNTDEPLPALDLDNLPEINDGSDYLQWLQALNHLIPDEPVEEVMAVPLRNESRLTQTLVITKADVPEESHSDLIESFFILKGECICTVGTASYYLKPGNFLEIPLHVKHTVQLTTPYGVGVLQHRMLV